VAGAVELRAVDAGLLGEPFEGIVPCQRVRPFVAEDINGLRLTHPVVEKDHEPLPPENALAQESFGEPGSPNDDGHGGRASVPKARQNRLKLAPARAIHEAPAWAGNRQRTDPADQGRSMAAQNGRTISGDTRHSGSVAPGGFERYPQGMDAPTPSDAANLANQRKAAELIYHVQLMKQQFLQCHDFLAQSTHKMVELLCEAESRGVLLDDALTLVDTSYWLQMIDWQTQFLSMVLNFTKEPCRKTLRPLIELYGRDRERMREQAEILERQLKHRLAKFAKPDDELVRKVVCKNERRVLAVYLHVRSGYRGIDVARFFKVPKTTAYGWLDWFKMLPEGLQAGILAFMDAQAPIMAACQVPTVMPKAVASKPAEASAQPAATTRSA